MDDMGMTLDYSTPGKVQVKMFDDINKLLQELPTDMDGTVNMPTADHQFLINLKPAMFDTETTTLFHHLVAMLLLLSKCT